MSCRPAHKIGWHWCQLCMCGGRSPGPACPCRLTSRLGCLACRPVWLGSLLAFVGTLIIAADRTGGTGPDSAAAGGEAAAVAAAALPLGDALTLLAALCYSAATVRIPVWAVRHRVSPLQIALGKAVALTAVAAAGLALEAAQAAGEGQSLAAFWPGWQQPEGWAILAWAALGPGALASVLHVKVGGSVGHARMSPQLVVQAACALRFSHARFAHTRSAPAGRSPPPCWPPRDA